MYGNKVSHAKNRTKRLFLPNLHYAKIEIAGGNKRVRLCTKCLRSLKKQMATHDIANLVRNPQLSSNTA